jgi:3-mercaptopropionate dioxygenase
MSGLSVAVSQPSNPVLQGLVRSIDSLHRKTGDARRLAEGAARVLRLFLGHPHLLSPAQHASDPERYRQHVLHVAPDGSFSIVALVWRLGQQSSIHDHVAWCAVGLHQGRTEEIAYSIVEEDGRQGLAAGAAETFLEGTVTALVPPGDIHLLRNPGPGEAISIHIYGADVRRLGTSIRHRYDLPVVRRDGKSRIHPLAAAGRE